MTTERRTMMITGAGGGIGRASVKLFAEKGWRVIGVDQNPFGEPFPEDGLFIQKSVTEVDAIFKEVTAFTDSLNALVNNAAIQYNKSLVDTTADEWDNLMAVNVRAPFLATQKAFPLLKKCKGAVVNVSSVHAVATSVGVSSYAASKGALLALTRAMAIEFAPDGVRANAVLPGAVDTFMLRDGLSRGHVSGGTVEDRLDELAKRTVILRVGTTEEIASAIFFLADNDQSSFMTGQPLIIDGGATTRLSTE
ncbi:MAG: SDR family oxidoreductase [Anaerolineales bacterium]|nr:SDR family oxidoreductase [Anaerolineales bacterium]